MMLPWKAAFKNLQASVRQPRVEDLGTFYSGRLLPALPHTVGPEPGGMAIPLRNQSLNDLLPLQSCIQLVDVR